MLPLLGAMGDAPQLTKEQQSQFASWPAGVLDAIMMPAPVDDEVHAPRVFSTYGRFPAMKK